MGASLQRSRIIAHNNYWIHFLLSGDGTEWIDAGLPMPNYFYRFNTHAGKSVDSYCMAYLLDGYFGTQKGIDALNDIVARFALTLPVKERLLWQPKSGKLHDKAYRLRDLQNLKSLTKKYVPRLRGQDNKDDNTFWELKLWLEHRIRDNGGEGSYVEFQGFFAHALEFYEFKDIATARAKCRNIWNWYEGRGWTYHMIRKSTKTKEEILMTRQERARSNARAKADRARRAVVNTITGLYANDYKKKNGSWHIKKISDATGVSRNVVAKYLKEWKEQQEL